MSEKIVGAEPGVVSLEFYFVIGDQYMKYWAIEERYREVYSREGKLVIANTKPSSVE